jgi:hypothetical protein
VSLIVFSGVVHGRRTNRWGPTPEIRSAVARLDRIARSLGEWSGEADRLSQTQMQQAEVDGAAIRRYKNRKSGAEVAVLIVCGSPGPIYAHTPEICYGGAGYEAEAAPLKLRLGSGDPTDEHAFLLERYRKRSAAVPTRLTILWSFLAGGKWNMSANPRVDFASQSLVYKLYVVYRPPSTGAPPNDDPYVEFVRRELLPELERVLLSPEG